MEGKKSNEQKIYNDSVEMMMSCRTGCKFLRRCGGGGGGGIMCAPG